MNEPRIWFTTQAEFGYIAWQTSFKWIWQGIIILCAFCIIPSIWVTDIYASHLSKHPFGFTLSEIDMRSIGLKNQSVGLQVWILRTDWPCVFISFLRREFQAFHFAISHLFWFPNKLFLLHQYFIHLHQPCHAARLRSCFNIKPMRLHHGPVIVLMSLTQLRGHGDFIV